MLPNYGSVIAACSSTINALTSGPLHQPINVFPLRCIFANNIK